MTAGRVLGTATIESHKRKLNGRGQGLAEPADVRLGREIVGKVGNSKKVVLEQTRHFSQVWTKMVVPLPTPFSFFFFLAFFCLYAHLLNFCFRLLIILIYLSLIVFDHAGCQ